MNWLDAAPFWERLLFGALGGGAIWWSAIDLGRRGWRLARGAQAPVDATTAAGGYALAGSLVGLLGLAHVLSSWPIIALLAAQFALRWYADRRFPLRLSRSPGAWFRELPPIDRAAAVVAVSAWFTGLIAAVLPATWWDPIAYHLPLVAFALQQHTFALQPMVPSAFPQLAEAAALPAFAIGGSAGAAVATLGSGIVLALVCGDWSERIAAGSRWTAVALVSCSALWLWLAPSFYVDVPFAMFAVAALSLAAQNGGRDAAGVAAWAGLLAGAAAATKYPGLFVAAIVLATSVVSAARGTRPRAAADLLAAALVVAGAWYLRTATLTGDPLFPFLSTHAPGDTGALAARYVTMTRDWCGGGASAADALALPWRLLTQPLTYCGDPGYALDLACVFVIASLALVRRTAFVLGACALLTGLWFFTSQQLRFFVPAMALFAIAAAAGTTVVPQRTRRIGAAALLLLCAVGVLVDWLPGPARDASNSIAPAYGYIAGSQSGDDYLSKRLEFYDAVLWIRGHSAGAHASAPQIAALDDVRDYYFGLSTRWLNPYYQAAAIDWSSSVAGRYRPLENSGYRYLIVNANPLYVNRTPTGVNWAVLDADIARGVLRPLFSSNDVTVYALPRPGSE